jgi:hypothetical protein
MIRANYLAYCELRLPIAVDPKGLVRGVRVCTGVNYITSDDGKTQDAAGDTMRGTAAGR